MAFYSQEASDDMDPGMKLITTSGRLKRWKPGSYRKARVGVALEEQMLTCEEMEVCLCRREREKERGGVWGVWGSASKTHCAIFILAVTKYLTNSYLRKKGFIMTCGLRE